MKNPGYIYCKWFSLTVLLNFLVSIFIHCSIANFMLGFGIGYICVVGFLIECNS